jgi:hypothetical protein
MKSEGDVLIGKIRGKIERRQYEFSKHAVDQGITRNISVYEFEQAMLDRSEIIEDYPNDKYGPSCLVLGFMSNGRALHVVCTCPETGFPLKVITLYEPDSALWINNRIRIMRNEK